MKVKTFCYGLINGYSKTFSVLDKAVEELCLKKIISVTDTYYQKMLGNYCTTNEFEAHLVRVIVYE